MLDFGARGPLTSGSKREHSIRFRPDKNWSYISIQVVIQTFSWCTARAWGKSTNQKNHPLDTSRERHVSVSPVCHGSRTLLLQECSWNSCRSDQFRCKTQFFTAIWRWPWAQQCESGDGYFLHWPAGAGRGGGEWPEPEITDITDITFSFFSFPLEKDDRNEPHGKWLWNHAGHSIASSTSALWALDVPTWNPKEESVVWSLGSFDQGVKLRHVLVAYLEDKRQVESSCFDDANRLASCIVGLGGRADCHAIFASFWRCQWPVGQRCDLDWWKTCPSGLGPMDHHFCRSFSGSWSAFLSLLAAQDAGVLSRCGMHSPGARWHVWTWFVHHWWVPYSYKGTPGFVLTGVLVEPLVCLWACGISQSKSWRKTYNLTIICWAVCCNLCLHYVVCGACSHCRDCSHGQQLSGEECCGSVSCCQWYFLYMLCVTATEKRGGWYSIWIVLMLIHWFVIRTLTGLSYSVPLMPGTTAGKLSRTSFEVIFARNSWVCCHLLTFLVPMRPWSFPVRLLGSWTFPLACTKLVRTFASLPVTPWLIWLLLCGFGAHSMASSTWVIELPNLVALGFWIGSRHLGWPGSYFYGQWSVLLLL